MILVIKNIINNILCSSHRKLLKLIESRKYEVISFDIFDTLIRRLTGKAEGVFYILQNEYKSKYNKNIDISKIRKEAEIRARKKAEQRGREEVSIIEIYNDIELGKNEKNWLMNKEMKLERALCVRNENICQLYEKAVQLKKRIIITSDMYLPKSVISYILNKNNIKNYDRLYLSSEIAKTKRRGGLFKFIIKNEKCDAKRVLHVGDDIISDLINSKIAGIKSCLSKKNELININDNVYLNVIQEIINIGGKKYQDPLIRLGYTVLGPLLYGFSEWLNIVIKNISPNEVLFLMREGKLLKSAFEIVNKTKTKPKLLYVSREATSLPYIGYASDLADLLKIIQARRVEYTIKDLFRDCHIVSDMGYDKNINIYKMSAKDQNRLFCTIKPKLQEISKIGRENLLKYLKTVGIRHKNLLVDVGYHGTIQHNLQKLVDKNEFFGAYMGSIAYNKCGESANGYFFNNERDEKLFDIALSSGLFELMFLSTEGTTTGYDSDGNPRLAGKDNDEIQNSRIMAMQEAALAFVKDINLLEKNFKIYLSADEWFSFYSDIVRTPTMDMVKLLQNIKFRDGKIEELIPKKNIFNYLLNPKDFLNDFAGSHCKILFMKAVFRLPLPYYNILYYARKIDKRK